MTYLFDTNIIIYYINGVPRARQLFTRYARAGVSISAITYMEVLDGIPGSPNPQIAEERFTNLMYHLPMIGFYRAEAVRGAAVRRHLREAQREWRRRAVDIMIAATAMEHDLTLVTNDTSDYDDIPGLKLEMAEITS